MVRQVTSADGHHETGTELIYGRRPVAEAERGRRDVLRVWRSPETSDDELTLMVESPDHQGVVAEVEGFNYTDGSRMIAQSNNLILVLDQIQDPRNLGALCRSAEAAGCVGVVIPDRRASKVTAVACKASAGAVEHLEVARVRNIADWLAAARDAGYWIWGAAGEGGTPPWGADLTGSTVLVMGGEGSGLRPRVAAGCDGLVAIPQFGKIDSLNVSAAASVVLFESVRQRIAAGTPGRP